MRIVGALLIAGVTLATAVLAAEPTESDLLAAAEKKLKAANEKVGPCVACLVEAAVNAQLSKSFHDAEELLLARFGEVTLAMLSDDVRARLAARRRRARPARR